MTNKELITSYLAGACTGKANSMFIDGDVLFSYGRHWPIALRAPKSLCINTDKVSPTTSTQTNKLINEAKAGGLTIDFKTREELQEVIE